MTPMIPPQAPPRARSRGGLLFALGVGVGLAIGFGLGVLSVKKARDAFASVFNDEKSADVVHTTAIDRPGFQLKYPGNWKVDTANASYEPDHHFTIDSPGLSFVMFSVADGDLAPKVAADAVVTAMIAKVMQNATRTPLTHWGAFDGEGAVLDGKNIGITPARVRVFAFRASGHTFTVTESTFDEDRAMVAPGLALVEGSFQVTAPRTP